MEGYLIIMSNVIHQTPPSTLKMFPLLIYDGYLFNSTTKIHLLILDGLLNSTKTF